MRLMSVLAAVALVVSPTFAQELRLRLVNDSSQIISALSVFPLDAAGEAIEDNLGGLYETVLPGMEAVVTISASCGPMLAVVTLADDSDLRVQLDTCQDAILQLSD